MGHAGTCFKCHATLNTHLDFMVFVDAEWVKSEFCYFEVTNDSRESIEICAGTCYTGCV